MKKIILLLAVLALGVVACDKNELGNMDEMSINPIEATVDVNTDKFASILTRLSSTKFLKKDNALTAKPNPVGSYIYIVDGSVDGLLYEFAYSDNNYRDLCNINAGLEGLYYILSNDQGHVAISDTADAADAFATIEDDFAFVFEFDILQGVEIDGSAFRIAAHANNVFTFN